MPETCRAEAQLIAWGPDFLGGVSVAAADENDDVIATPGAGGGPAVVALDAQTGQQLDAFMAFDPGFRGGVYVAAVNKK
ncbi:hypothetical protein [Fimbriiglobus ruber]|uniref:Alkaline phosphatase n=1 Tax=Fimbriiglobus ruber TaxID=1908690 RepID=A0A225E193_9BACT|nr:hypothetical protein [Fimbriiglobus ruber]OWK47362.1 Alkaline phosphatase [Fimbriiglobus ruber]